MEAPVSPETGTYLYAIVRARTRPSRRGVPRGLPGASTPRLVDADGDLWLVVADVPWTLYSADAINRNLRDLTWVSRCAVAHEAVVEAFLERGVVLPAKLFTIFTEDERAVRHVAGQRAQMDRLLDRIAGHREWGVRVSLRTQPRKGRLPVRRSSPASGREYLAAKRAALAQKAELSGRAETTVRDVHARLERIAVDSRRRPPITTGAESQRLLLDAAYLVPVRRAAAFRAAATRLGRQLAADGYSLVLSGPWPPYNFVSDQSRSGS